MRALIKTLLIAPVLLLTCSLFAQSGSLNEGQIQTFTLQNDSIVIRASAFLEDASVKYDLEQTYHSYSREQIIKTQGSHLGHLLHGHYQRYSREMELQEEGQFEYGLQVGQWKYWQEGYLYQVVDFRKGARHGDFVQYAADGSIEIEAEYRNNELHGDYQLFEDGELSASKKFRQGEEVVKPEKSEGLTQTGDSSATTETSPSVAPPSSAAEREERIKERRRSKSSSTSTRRNQDRPSSSNTKTVTASPPTTEQTGSGTTQIFITDKETGQGLKQVSIKVSQFERSPTEDASFQFFGYTNPEGHYQLENDDKNYVLFITQRGYRPFQLRIEAARRQDTYLVALEPTPTCGQLTGKVQPAAKNTAVSGAAIHIKDTRGRLIKSTYSNSRGEFSACLPCNERYQLIVEGDGFQRYEEQVFLPPNCIDVTEEVALYLPSNQRRPAYQQQPNSRPDTRIAQNEALTDTQTGRNRPQGGQSNGRFASNADQLLFFVIAGTFSSRTNAERRLAQVKDAGFEDAMIIELSDSGYFAVSVGNLDSRSAAAALKQRFERLTQIDAYVRDKPF